MSIDRVIMNKYKYRITNKINQEIWVCETCKKGAIESILTGQWKLIDRSVDPKILCAVCDKAVVKERI
jgi:hypothetical protein